MDGGQADAASGPLNQDPFALLQPGEMVQRIVDRHRCDRERRGFLEAHRCRFLEETKGRRNEMGRERVAAEAEDGVPRTEAIDAVADLDYLACELHAERRTRETALERFLGQEANALQNITEVYTRRPDMHGGLPGGGPRDGDPLQDYGVLRFSVRKG